MCSEFCHVIYSADTPVLIALREQSPIDICFIDTWLQLMMITTADTDTDDITAYTRCQLLAIASATE